MPKWMAGIESIAPVKALGLGVALAAANPKNAALVIGASAGIAQLGASTADAVAALVAFVVVGSLSVAIPVVYYPVGGPGAKATLDELRGWLATHSNAVMAVLFLVFGVVLIANGIPPLSD